MWQRWFCCGLAIVAWSAATAAWADGRDRRLDLYFIDVEGGAATLLVTPAGESLLVDSGYPDNGGRDKDRIWQGYLDALAQHGLSRDPRAVKAPAAGGHSCGSGGCGHKH